MTVPWRHWGLMIYSTQTCIDSSERERRKHGPCPSNTINLGLFGGGRVASLQGGPGDLLECPFPWRNSPFWRVDFTLLYLDELLPQVPPSPGSPGISQPSQPCSQGFFWGEGAFGDIGGFNCNFKLVGTLDGGFAEKGGLCLTAPCLASALNPVLATLVELLPNMIFTER